MANDGRVVEWFIEPLIDGLAGLMTGMRDALQ